MKKLLFLISVIALVFALTACGGDTTSDGNATNDNTSDTTPDSGDGGQTPDTPPHEHVFVKGECECGEKDPNYVPPHEHVFVNGECECGEKDPNYVPPHEHVFVNGECECGEKDPNYVPPHEHVFVNGECECGEKDPNYVPPHEHVFVNGECECGEKDPNYVPPHEHVFVKGECECGEKDPNYVPPHEHVFVKGECECGEKDPNYVPPHEHVFVKGECECGEKDPNYVPELKEITGITFANKTVTYNGKEQSIAISGTLPEGVSVSYTGEKGTDADTYDATAILSGEGYITKTLTAKLIIKKADITGITADAEQSAKESGTSLKPSFKGDLPIGVSVKYYFDGLESDGVINVGTYNVRIVFEGKNYNSLIITVSFRIKENINLVGYADKVIDAFGSVPDPWSFLPDSFTKNSFSTTATVGYDDFTNVSNIPTNGMGKQLHMVYGVVTKADTALGYVNKVYGTMNIIKSLYTTFLDESPEDYKHFSDTAAGITFAITITEDQYILSATVESVEIIIFSNLADETYGAKIQLTETTVLKYTVSGEKLTVAVDILDSVASMITFERGDGAVTGMLYEYATIGGVDVISNSALLNVGEKYTVIIGTKGDFLLGSEGRNSEVYDNATGKFVGSEVREDTSTGTYNTYWFPLCNLNGVISIKKLDEANKTNPDTIWINGSSDTLHTKLYLGISLKAGSRRFDIEFKDVYFFNYDEEKEKYVEVCMEIPMLFVQEEKLEDFESDFNKANEDALGDAEVTLNVAPAVTEAIAHGYNNLLPVYDEQRELITKEMIQNYCKQ